MPYSIPSFTKILTLAAAPLLFLLVGVQNLFFLRAQMYIHNQQNKLQKDLNPCLPLYSYGKVIVVFEKRHKQGT